MPLSSGLEWVVKSMIVETREPSCAYERLPSMSPCPYNTFTFPPHSRHHEETGRRFVCKFDIHLQHCTLTQSGRPQSQYTQPRKRHILYKKQYVCIKFVSINEQQDKWSFRSIIAKIVTGYACNVFSSEVQPSLLLILWLLSLLTDTSVSDFKLIFDVNLIFDLTCFL